MNVLFTICGRAGSKGLKNKNLKTFLGTPLVYYTMAAIDLYKSAHPNEIVHTCLNTDSDDLISLVTQRDPNTVVVRRTPDLAGDRVAKLPVIQDCLVRTAEQSSVVYDTVVDLDITSPLRRLIDIENAIQKRADQGLDVVFSVTEARRSPYFNMVKQNSDGTCEKVLQSNFTSRQQAPELYDMNASIYAYAPTFLHENTTGMQFDGRCGFVEMPDTGILDIDSEQDFLLMEVIAAHLESQDAELKAVMEAARKGL
jgi:CMP-N,N'-diacetyllegionaminic acid synthase